MNFETHLKRYLDDKEITLLLNNLLEETKSAEEEIHEEEA